MCKKSFFILLAGSIIGFNLMAQNPFETYSQVKKMEDESIFKKLQWIPSGPTFQGGRVETIECPPDQSGVIYAGFGSGSLWKTTDQGLHWKCIFENEATGSIGDLEISKSNPDILYLGTGESMRAAQGYAFPGTGVYKSTDGGMTWKHMGLANSHHIGRVVVDPNDANLVFVAVMGHMWTPNTERGLFISRDGGETWEKKLYLSDHTGVIDIGWDPVNRILYAATWEMINGSQSGIFRSANLGSSWERCTAGLPDNSGIGRIGLAISPSHPQTVYAVVDNRNTKPGSNSNELVGAEVYRSDDSGKSWSRTHKNYLDIYSGSGWAFGDIRVSPIDRKVIYVLGIQTVQSTDGGATFSRLGGNITHLEPNRSDFLHLDHHDLFIDPSFPDRLILGTAGGVFLSHDNGKDWLHLNNIPAGEFHDIYIDNRSAVPVVYGGTKDNAGISGPLSESRSNIGNSGWDYVWIDPWSGGDGFTIMPDPTDTQVCYYAGQNGYLNRKNLVTGESAFIQPVTEPGESPMRTSWFTPWFISKFSSSSLYFGANKVYKSIDRGDHWYRLSPDLCYSKDTWRKSRALTALAESPVKSGLLYAATEKGAAWISRDDGITWIEISEGLPVQSVECITPSCHEEGRVYIALKSLDEDNYQPFLFKSDNRGVSWKSISAGLPEDRINYVLEDPYLQDLVFVATDRGIYYSPDQGTTWTSVSYSLPTVSVQKLAWASENQYLVAATHGRGLFSLFAVPLRKYYKSINPEEAGMLAIKNGILPVQKDYPGDFDWSRYNPVIAYWYQPMEGLMTILISDSADKKVFASRIQADSGINVWSWDLLTERKEDSGLYPVPENKFPVQGSYSITIQGQGIVLKSNLTIR
ncbi:MAG: hypothetical protein V2A67_09325 [Bacteroidota bacterium]